MRTNEFDNLLKDKFDEGEFAYNPDSWSRLSMQLPDKKPWNRSAVMLFLLSGIAACFALTFTVSIWLHRSGNIINDNTIAATKAITHEKAKVNTNAIQNSSPQSGGTTITEKQKNNKVYKNRPDESEKPASNFIALKDNRKAAADITNSETTFSEPLAQAANKNANPFIGQPQVYEQEKEDRQEDKANKKISVSLAGGFNYNASNNGFMLGATAQKKISNKVYLEGSVAYVSNNISQQHQESDPGGINNTLGGVFTIKSAPVTVTEPSNIRYLQMTPAVGCNVLKHLSVGVGADFQQLLNNDQTNFITTGETTKELPSLDMGVVGKTEYKVSKTLSAGLQYREAVNNVISGGNRYYDRNYLQVQVKVNILGK
jgi:hypothetical protein